MTSLKGLYVVTPEYPSPPLPLSSQVAEAIAGGARFVQYRSKDESFTKRLGEGKALRDVCRAAGIPLIVNDDLDLAEAIGADGIHLGRDDVDPSVARARLGKAAIIGVSCYDRFDRAAWACEIGADYVAFGRFYPSATKPFAVQAHPELLRRARRELAIPLVAIGGITPENGRSLIVAGADMLAVVGGVFGQTDMRAAAQNFARLFAQGGRNP
jgi:thiamine-phosphate pyrophosphorylase